TGGDEKFHWLSLIPLMLFIVGALCSSATLILVTSVTVKEAHGMETALHDFVSKDLSRKDVMFQIEDKTQTLANFAAGFGVISAALFTLGCLFGLAQLIVFF
ncbi:hypothetical protein N8612_06975, partial [Verrucomicrobia bacterium]|nr:hypothetical protein [Verrucomicrobiota bacterium]